MTPLTHPTTHPWDYQDGDTKRGDVGLIKVKKQVEFILGDLKHFKTMFFFHLGCWLAGSGSLMEISINFFCFCFKPSLTQSYFPDLHVTWFNEGGRTLTDNQIPRSWQSDIDKGFLNLHL